MRLKSVQSGMLLTMSRSRLTLLSNALQGTDSAVRSDR